MCNNPLFRLFSQELPTWWQNSSTNRLANSTNKGVKNHAIKTCVVQGSSPYTSTSTAEKDPANQNSVIIIVENLVPQVLRSTLHNFMLHSTLQRSRSPIPPATTKTELKPEDDRQAKDAPVEGGGWSFFKLHS